MLTQRAANIVFVILVIVACGYFAVVAQGFETSGLLASSGLPSKFFPQLLLALTAFCALIVGAMYAFRGSAGGDEGELVFKEVGDARRGLLMMAVTIVCYLVWAYVGFIAMAITMGPLSLLAMGVRSLRIYLTVLILTGLIFVVFTQFLGVQFI